MLVNHLGLNLTKADMESVVELMEPYGQISNGIELYSPPLDVSRHLRINQSLRFCIFYFMHTVKMFDGLTSDFYEYNFKYLQHVLSTVDKRNKVPSCSLGSWPQSNCCPFA